MFWIGALAASTRERAVLAAPAQRAARRFAFAVAALVFVMALTGGFVAGIRAGFAYNTFPLMNGSVVPPEILSIDPWWKNFFWNMATVQFDHRALAWLLAIRRSAPLVEAAVDATGCRRAHARAATCCSRSSCCRSRSASRPCSSSCRSRSPRRIRPARCWCSRRRSTLPTRCADAHRLIRIKERRTRAPNNGAMMLLRIA